MISEQKDFSNSEYQCCPDGQTLQTNFCCNSDTSFGRFQESCHGSYLGYQESNDFSDSESLCCPMPPTRLKFNQIYGSVYEEMSFEICISSWPIGTLEWKYSAILNLHVAPKPPTSFQSNQTYRLEGDVVCKISRWPAWEIGMEQFSMLP